MNATSAFERFATSYQVGDPATADVMSRCANDEVALALLPDDPSWDMPHRLLAGVRLLAARGEVDDFESAGDPWAVFRSVLVEHGDWIGRFVRDQTIQTHVVQRCWVLLPLFLTIAKASQKPLDLIELGESGGLNLLWDRYFYRYKAGTWGAADGSVELSGDERTPIPAELLDVQVTINRRTGIDLHAVDVTSQDGLRLLLAFRRDDRYEALLEHSAEILRQDPPELIEGNYIELLPEMLKKRDPSALTVVFQTHSTIYLPVEERRELRSIIETAGAEGPLGWISTPTPEEHGERRGDYPLELGIWPGGERKIVARTNVRATWLEWQEV